MRFELKNDRVVLLGYRPDPIDDRDFRMGASAPKQIPYRVDYRRHVRAILDQESEGACTGFAVCGAAELLFGECCEEKRPAPDLSERWAYHQARRFDPWKGENYHGSTLRAALTGWQRMGICEDEFWRFVPYAVDPRDSSFDLVGHEGTYKGGALESAGRYRLASYYRLDTLTRIKEALAERHAVLIGAYVHTGWDIAGESKIAFNGKQQPLGAHAFLLVGYDEADATFVVANSWGTKWGEGGFARLSYDDLRTNMIDAWAAVVACRCDP